MPSFFNETFNRFLAGMCLFLEEYTYSTYIRGTVYKKEMVIDG
jgi:hypothetical protein